jgi:hypothetical protein
MFDSDGAEMFKSQILNQPVVERDIVSVMLNPPFMRSPSRTISLTAVATEETTVTIQEESE